MGIGLGSALLISSIIGATAATTGAVLSSRQAKKQLRQSAATGESLIPAPKKPEAPKSPIRGAAGLSLIKTSTRGVLDPTPVGRRKLLGN